MAAWLLTAAAGLPALCVAAGCAAPDSAIRNLARRSLGGGGPQSAILLLSDPAPSVGAVAEGVREEAREVAGAAAAIRTASDPADRSDQAQPVLRQTARLDLSVARLEGHAQTLDQAVPEVRRLRDAAISAKEQLDRAEAERREEAERSRQQIAELEAGRTKLLNLLLSAIAALAVLGLGAAAFLAFEGSRLSVGLGLGCATCIAASVALLKFSLWIALAGVGLVGLVGLIGLVRLLRDYKRATSEVVHTAEVTKNALAKTAPITKADIFGEGVRPGIAFGIQSRRTEDIVREERRALNRRYPSRPGLPAVASSPQKVP